MAITPSLKQSKLCVVQLGIHQWTGTRTLSKDEVDLNNASISQEMVASWGLKKIINPARLKIFNTIKQRAICELNQVGLPFLSNSYAIPLKSAEVTLAKLQKHMNDYNKAADDFISNFPKLVDEWCSINPQYENAIRNSVPSVQELRKKIHADFYAMNILPLSDKESQKIDKEIVGLSDKLYESISKDASKLFSQSLSSRIEGTRRVLSPFKKMRDKLSGLAFLDGGAQKLVDLLDQLISQASQAEEIKGEIFWKMQVVAGIMSDIQRMQSISNGSLSLDQLAQRMASPMLTADSGDEEPDETTILSNETTTNVDPAQFTEEYFTNLFNERMQETEKEDPDSAATAAAEEGTISFTEQDCSTEEVVALPCSISDPSSDNSEEVISEITDEPLEGVHTLASNACEVSTENAPEAISGDAAQQFVKEDDTTEFEDDCAAVTEEVFNFIDEDIPPAPPQSSADDESMFF